MKIVLFLSFAVLLWADVVPHDQAYYTKKVRNTELIYTENNSNFAQQAANVEMALQPLYEEKFGYVMDEELHVGLTSGYNQIANGFSTQFPNNRQINYIGGAMSVDYFSSTSWLNTLLYHETTHNYQLNAKDNVISSSLHSVLGNSGFILPYIIIPNMVESSFLLEGNAVLNESWHGNGGRLYSGRFKAAMLMQAKAGYLTPQRVYNDNLFFLYGSHFYTLGSFYQKYLAETYGLKKTNSYWKKHSQDWFFPFYTNNSMERAVGVDFESSLEAWNKQMQEEAKQLVEPHGKVIATSQFFTPLNANKKEIYFITNESGRETPDLIVYDKDSASTTKDTDSWFAGKVVKVDGEFTTQASVHTSPWRIYEGLVDDGGFMLDTTKGKVVEGYLEDGRMVYFDVLSSYDQPQLYIGEEYYTQVNSSVFINANDVYYFKQKGKTRTLYKNKEKMFSIEGYYAYVSGIGSDGGVYFIANSEHGSGLYKYNNTAFYRESKADTIIDARLIDDTHALVASIGSDEFVYQVIALEDVPASPHEVKLFVEDAPYYKKSTSNTETNKVPKIDLDTSYYSFLNMNYSGANVAFGSSTQTGFIYNLSLNFADPLTQNSLSVFARRNFDEYTLAGASYTNTQYFLQYFVSGYGVLERPDTNLSSPITEERNFGLVANVSLPFVQVGRYSAALSGSYYQDYESASRKPLSLSLPMSRIEQYGVSMYPSSLISLTPYASNERDDISYGANAAFRQGLGAEFYLSLYGQYSKSDSNGDALVHNRGVKLVASQAQQYADLDPTTMVMESIKDTTFIKSASKGSASIASVFNLSAYYFTFPLSIRRESIVLTYNYYDLESFVKDAETTKVNEAIAGVTFDTLIFNTLPLPITLEYIYNDNEYLAQEYTFRLSLGTSF